MTTALVTGITGQDGHYLTSHLMARGVSVVGTSRTREGITLTRGRIPVRTVRLDLTSQVEIERTLREVRPDLIFNLAARASSSQLFDSPIDTAEANAMAVLRLLEGVRTCCPTTKLVQASSSEVFAGSTTVVQTEGTAYAPTNAYGAAKAFADHCVRAYRTTHGIHASSAILYSHESPLRDEHFLVRKVTVAAARAAEGFDVRLALGNLSARRDWGAADDYMSALVSIADLPEPDDYLVGSGETHSVQDVCEIAFSSVGRNFREFVTHDPALSRQQDTGIRCANFEKLNHATGWRPSRAFAELVAELVAGAREQIVSNGV